jgi:hypothetical protein
VSDRDTDPAPIQENENTVSLAVEIKKRAKPVVAVAMTLLMALLGYWTTVITQATMRAEDVAETAATKGTKAAKVAVIAKAETAAAYDVTREKSDALGDIISKLVVEVAALREDVEKMKAAKTGRRVRKQAPIVVPSVVKNDLPENPAAAAEAAKE